jgi:hypothetical protein
MIFQALQLRRRLVTTTNISGTKDRQAVHLARPPRSLFVPDGSQELLTVVMARAYDMKGVSTKVKVSLTRSLYILVPLLGQEGMMASVILILFKHV